MIRRISRPELAAHEDEFNRLMRMHPLPDGTIKQVCLHVDRTVHTTSDTPGSMTTCDYCNETVFDQGWGPVPDLMPWIWTEKINAQRHAQLP